MTSNITAKEAAAAKVKALLDDAERVLDGLRSDDRDPELQAYVAAQIPVFRAALVGAWGVNNGRLMLNKRT